MPNDAEFSDDVAILLSGPYGTPPPVPGASNYNAYHAALLRDLGATEVYSSPASFTLNNFGAVYGHDSRGYGTYWNTQTVTFDIPEGTWSSYAVVLSWTNVPNGEAATHIYSDGSDNKYYINLTLPDGTLALEWIASATPTRIYYSDLTAASYKTFPNAGPGFSATYFSDNAGTTVTFQLYYASYLQSVNGATNPQHYLTVPRLALMLFPPQVLATGEFAAGTYAYNARQIVEARGSGLSYDVSDSGRHYHAYALGGTIRVGAATNVLATSWQDVDTGIEGSFPWIRVQKCHRNQLLWLFYVAADGSLQSCSSTDEGRTWGAPEEIASAGGYPSLDITRDGRHYFYWRASDGSIQGKVKDNADKIMLDTFTALPAGTADDAGIACREFTTGGGVWRIKLTYFSGGDIVDVSSRDGVNFT